MIGDDLTVRDVPGAGRVAYVLPTIPDDAPDDVREGIARRRIVAVGGVCPCGAYAALPNRAERRAAKRAGRVLRVDVEHAADCPAITDNLVAAVRRWST